MLRQAPSQASLISELLHPPLPSPTPTPSTASLHSSQRSGALDMERDSHLGLFFTCCQNLVHITSLLSGLAA